MNKTVTHSTADNAIRIVTAVVLFCYFGFIIIPEWSRPFPRYLIWLLLLPIVLFVLVVYGIRGGIGLWREKARKVTSNPQNKYFVWLAGLGILWFLISMSIANTTQFAYSHQKFDSAGWKSHGSAEGSIFDLSLRQRMFDDLTKNVLPGRTKKEVLNLLGEPNERRNNESEDSFIYYYGQGIADPECLIITFDDQDHFRDYSSSECG